jgi:preprotein translocase subunit YajC
MMNHLNLITLMAAPQQGQSAWMSFLPLLLIILVFYFFMIRPQMKRQKELNNFRNNLKRGDSVLTTGGIYGKVFDIKEQYIVIEIDNSVKLRIDKAAIMKDPADLASK